MQKLFTTLLAALTLNMAAEAQHLVGGDISLLPRYEEYNTPYYDADGKKIDDVLLYMRDVAGWNAMRVRLFVEPNAAEAKDGVIQDLNYVTALGKRIKEAGLKLMLDFHYSDSWADPTHQKLPASWSDCKTADQKATRLYDYTKECLNTMVQAGATPDYVQVGNEISYGMVGIQVHPYDYSGDDWTGLLKVLTQGCKAVRECCPEAQIIIHTERAAKANDTEYYYKKIASLDYDIIGLSYYPIWHAPLATLSGTLNKLQSSFPNKKVQIVETAYNYNYWPSSGVNYDTRSTWPCSAAGQQKFTQDLVAELVKHSNVEGLYWWFPEENGNGGASWNASTIVINTWLNRGLWSNDTHRALPALMELKALRAGDSGISEVTDDKADGQFYDLKGRRMNVQDWQSLPHGIYVRDGKKMLK